MEAEVKTQEDELLDIQIPATLAPGDYTISVTTPFEKIEKTLDFEILPNPVLTSIEPLKGYRIRWLHHQRRAERYPSAERDLPHREEDGTHLHQVTGTGTKQTSVD